MEVLMSLRARIIAAALLAFAALTASAKEFVLQVNGAGGTPFSAEYHVIRTDGSIVEATVHGVTPQQLRFEGRSLAVTLRSTSPDAQLSAEILRDGRRVSQGSASGARAYVILRAGEAGVTRGASGGWGYGYGYGRSD
jgi:hypothetical protein